MCETPICWSLGVGAKQFMKLTPDRKHFLSILFQHHSVRFTEPLMEIESGPTSQIFLTEIYLKDPLEIDFAQLNNDKIALAKQTSTESGQCHAAANVLETSFKVEKYFSTSKLFKQISIDEEEPPGILKKCDHFMQCDSICESCKNKQW